MNFSAIYHRTSDNYCYPLNDNQLIVNLKTGYDVEKVYIWYGDPFETGILGGNSVFSGRRIEIPFKKKLKNHIWWTTTLEPEYKRCRYYFELISEEETFYYFEDGFFTEEEKNIEGKMLQCFTFPWLNCADVNKTPRWVNDAVWYQIFPERFCNGDKSNDPECVKEWREQGAVTNEEYFGGDLAGIKEKLDYLKDLGITALYLNPIFKAGTSHKYDTIDYMEIDPQFGDKEVFKELVDEAHAKGMKIMLDGVFNHVGDKAPVWQDVLEKGPESEFYDWFMINKWPFDKNHWDTRDKSFYSFGFTPQMPKLNTNNKDVRSYILYVCEYWAKEFNIDGIRLDVANEISHKLCKELREHMKMINPDFYILGEIWHDSVNWLRGDEFDAVMNYPLTSAIGDFWLNKKLTKEDFEFMINHCYTTYMQQTNDVLFNLLDSHDTERIINRVKDIEVFYQQLAILFTMPGSPCIYYGTEIALEGGADPDCRRCMPWQAIEAGKFDDRISIMKSLIALRKSEDTFRSRNFHFPNTINNPRVIEYIKIDEFGNNKIEVILNCDDKAVEIEDNKYIIFSRMYSLPAGGENGKLEKHGILIRRLN